MKISCFPSNSLISTDFLLFLNNHTEFLWNFHKSIGRSIHWNHNLNLGYLHVVWRWELCIYAHVCELCRNNVSGTMFMKDPTCEPVQTVLMQFFFWDKKETFIQKSKVKQDSYSALLFIISCKHKPIEAWDLEIFFRFVQTNWKHKAEIMKC